MTISTDGQICYGIKLDEDVKLPWEKDKDSDIEYWWIYKVMEYKNPFELFNEEGNWIGGKKPGEDKISEYYDSRRDFESAHPLPVELVNYCSGDYSMYIIAIPETVLTCSGGYPVRLRVPWAKANRETVINFVEKYITTEHEEPEWWLSSYWG